MDNRIKAIRANKKVGRGSCSSIDECYEPEELIELLDEAGANTEAEAVEWAMKREGHYLERLINCRAGNDDDPLLRHYNWFFDLNN